MMSTKISDFFTPSAPCLHLELIYTNHATSVLYQLFHSPFPLQCGHHIWWPLSPGYPEKHVKSIKLRVRVGRKIGALNRIKQTCRTAEVVSLAPFATGADADAGTVSSFLFSTSPYSLLFSSGGEDLLWRFWYSILQASSMGTH